MFVWELTEKRIYNKELIRKLNTTYIDFATLKALEEASPTENSKLKLVFLDKLLSIINLEQELVYRQMEFPKFFINIETEWKSPFYLNNEVVNSTDVMEIITGIFNTKGALYRIDRKDIFFSDFAHIVEKLFNIEFGDIYKKERSVIKRTPNKKTDFWDRLKAVMFQKRKDEGYI